MRRIVAAAGRHRVLLGIVALGALLRLWGLGQQSLWYDEWLTAEATSGGLGDLPGHVANREGHPPTYFVLMWLWTRLFGQGEVALRSVSALAGIATIPLVYAVVRELLPQRGRGPGWVAALLVAVNPMLVWYSQEARPYGLLACMGTASLLAWVRLWRHGRRSDLVLWAAVCATFVAVHYFAAFLVVAEAVALVVATRIPRAVPSTGNTTSGATAAAASPQAGQPEPAGPVGPARWADPVRDVLMALVPSGVVLLVLAPVALRQHSHEGNRLWISDFSVSHRFAEAGRAAFVGPSPPSGRLWFVGAAVAAVAALFLVMRAGREERVAAGFAAGIGAGAVLLPLVATVVGVDVVLSRYLIASLVPLVVAVAVGLTVPRTRIAGLVAVAALVAASLFGVAAVAREPDLQRAEWRRVADVVRRGDGDRVLVLNVHGGMGSPLRHYLDGARRIEGREAVRVEAVDVLVARQAEAPCNFLVGRACAMVFLGAPPPAPLMDRGLTLQERVQLDQFTVDRYRFRDPATVTRADLVGAADRASSLVLLIPG